MAWLHKQDHRSFVIRAPTSGTRPPDYKDLHQQRTEFTTRTLGTKGFSITRYCSNWIRSVRSHREQMFIHIICAPLHIDSSKLKKFSCTKNSYTNINWRETGSLQLACTYILLWPWYRSGRGSTHNSYKDVMQQLWGCFPRLLSAPTPLPGRTVVAIVTCSLTPCSTVPLLKMSTWCPGTSLHIASFARPSPY